MRKNKYTWKYIVLFVFLWTIQLCNQQVMAINDNNDIKMEISYGYENHYKLGKYMPINIVIDNKGTDIEGTIEIEVPQNNEKYNIYSESIILPKDTKKNYKISIPVNSYFDSIDVRVKSKGKTLIETKKYIGSGRLVEDKLLMGILSEDFNSITYLNSGNINYKIVKLEEVPEKEIDLDMFDTICINNYDTSKLSKESYESLKKWVNNGGELIIGTGPSYANTLSKINDDFLVGSIKQAKKVKTSFGKKTIKPIEIEIQEIDIKSKNIYSEKDIPLIKEVEKENGKITICLFDLGLEPLSNWESNKELGAMLLNKQVINTREGLYDYWDIKQVISIISNLKLPKIMSLIIILSIYVIVVGIINYLILKRMDKRYLIWLTVPILSIVFSIIIYSIGKPTRINSVIINNANIVTINNNKISTNSYYAIIPSKKMDVELDIKENESIMPLGEFHGDFTVTNSNKKINRSIDIEINSSGERKTIKYNKLRAFESRIISTNTTSRVKESMKIDINYYDSVLKGTIKNQLPYNLENAFVWSGNKIVTLGDIKNNQEITLDKNMKNIGTVNDFYQMSMMVLYNNKDPYVARKDMKLEDKIKTRQKEEMFRWIDRKFIEAGYDNKNNKSYIVGFTYDKIQDSIFVDKNIREESISLVLIPFDMNFEKDGVIIYPEGFISPRIIFGDIDPHANILYGAEGTVQYDIKDEIIPEEITFSGDAYSNINAEVSIFNYLTQKYDKINYNNEVIGQKELNKYIKDNIIQLQIKNNNTNQRVKLPNIKVKGRRK